MNFNHISPKREQSEASDQFQAVLSVQCILGGPWADNRQGLLLKHSLAVGVHVNTETKQPQRIRTPPASYSLVCACECVYKHLQDKPQPKSLLPYN